MNSRKSFWYILAAYSVCQLVILAGNITIVILRYFVGPACDFAWPSSFSGRGFDLPDMLEWFIRITTIWLVWARVNFQCLVNRFVPDIFNIASLIVAPAILEEIQYRGPLWLLKNYPAYTWWPICLLINVCFLLAHNTAPIYLIYIFAFAMMAAWLVRQTGKLWPAIILHMLYNTFWIFGGVTLL